MSRITAVDVRDIRFPTSRHLDGSDAMNPDPDYSAAYVVIHTDGDDEGYALVFTIGRGTDVQAAAVRAVAPAIVGRDADELVADLGGMWRELTGDSQLRWLGPDKGIMHMAIGAIVNAMWDLYARRERKPVWELLSDMSPAQLVNLVDFRYLEDALTRSEALDLLERAADGRGDRKSQLLERGYPAYTTTPGWLGYSDEKLARLAREAVADGFDQIKLKVGGSLDDDVRRMRIAREAVGSDFRVAVDANQRWGVAEAIDWVTALKPFDPYWIEEPTSPDDILGHAAIRRGVAPVRVASGEHGCNQVLFKQLMQAEAIDVAQIDACRVAGINENVAIIVLAAKHGIAVCPHAGGVGLCELVQHLAMFDFVAVSGQWDDRRIEFVDHLHEHFVDPVVVRDGRYVAPRSPGFSSRMYDESLNRFAYPNGPEWKDA